MRFRTPIFFLLGCSLFTVSVLTGQTILDTDGDLVPDAVETLWGMNPMDPADALFDLDGDGLNAQQEYALGGDPGVRNQAIEVDPRLNELKVRELVNPETLRAYLGWSEDLTDWDLEGFSQVANASDQVLNSSLVNLDSPIGTVREWTYQLAGDGNIFFRTEIESTGYAAVFRKLHKGVNLDVSRINSGVWPKSQHQAAQMQAIAEAGFESVRIFTTYFASVSETEQQIDDALDNDLAIVVCLWGLNSWSGNVSLGEQQISQKWGDLAKRWKDYPSDLVFEILNEPRGIGFQNATGHANAMRLYNVAAQAIRDEDPDRPILMGVPGHNDSEHLDPYVTEEHLTYTFDEGKGFYDDPNIGVAIHFYNPKHVDGLNFAMWTAPLGNDESRWKDPITEQIMYAVDWRERLGIDIPVITTEWGAWLFPTRDASGDLEKWLAHHFDLFNTHDIGSMWYTGIQHNQRAFAIFDTELGWHPIVTPVLTGQVIPTSWPNIDQMINGEFFSDDGWQLSTDAITASIQSGSAFSGKTMMKLTVPELESGGQLYLQTFVTNSEPPGRYLFHLIEGQSYRISFIARSEDPDGLMKVLLKDVGSGAVFYESAETSLGTRQKTYEFFYTHDAADAMDVRLEFDIGSKAQVLYLDKVEFIRQSESGFSVTVDTDSGTRVEDYSMGDNVSIDANPAPSGQVFDQWIYSPSLPTGADSASAGTSFIMPSNDVGATAYDSDLEAANIPDNGDFSDGNAPWQVWVTSPAATTFSVENDESRAVTL